MGKYDKASEKAKAEQEFIKEQKALHEKYQEPDNVIIKEKSNMTKFMINTARGLIQTAATIILFVLATIGILTLVYPGIRTELFAVLESIYREVLNMIK